MVIAWIVLGVVLLAFELHHLAFFALFAAIGAFAAAVVASAAPSAIIAQILVGGVVTAVGIRVARPYVSRVVVRRSQGFAVRGVHGGFIGMDAFVTDGVADAERGGHVRLAGEQWLAVSGDGRPLAAGTKVVVTGVAGTTLTVWPVDPVPDLGADATNLGPPPEADKTRQVP
jgi:membrane protein implicated in regulation of membrane protease activity